MSDSTESSSKAEFPTSVAPAGFNKLFEIGGVVALVLLGFFNFHDSWRKWNHPLIDFGRELYLPWRLSEGAVLYRDVDDVYGPFSQYFNAGIFRVFGPGLTILAGTNFVIVGAITAVAYFVFRRAWGPVGAWVAGFIFITLFAFNQALFVSNFNYIAPYSHEATHGVLVCLALTAALGKWLEAPTVVRSVGAGLLLGLTLVLKPEFILAGTAVVAAAATMRRRRNGSISRAELLGFTLAASLPTLVFFLYFCSHFPPADAAMVAGRAWTSLLVHSDITSLKYQRIFMGFDDPWQNLALHGKRTALVAVILFGIGYALRFGLRLSWRPRLVVVGLLVLVTVGIGQVFIVDHLGPCLLGLMLLYLGLYLAGRVRSMRLAAEDVSASVPWRILLGVLAAAMMARMCLNGRVVQFGFFQAVVATMVLGAVLSSEFAEWMPKVRFRRTLVFVLFFTLAGHGMEKRISISRGLQKMQSFEVGSGRDGFFAYAADFESTGFVVNSVVEYIKTLPSNYTLLTLPEGSMINYLSRRSSPLPQFQFYGFTTEGGRETEIVRALQTRPPDLVAIVGRDLRDFDVSIYGERDGAGRQIMLWIAANYHVIHMIGRAPLDSSQGGAYILKRKDLGAL